MRSFSSRVIDAPGDCSPSRKVVSKIMSLSVMVRTPCQSLKLAAGAPHKAKGPLRLHTGLVWICACATNSARWGKAVVVPAKICSYLEFNTILNTAKHSLMKTFFIWFIGGGADHTGLQAFGFSPCIENITTQAVHHKHSKQHNRGMDIDHPDR